MDITISEKWQKFVHSRMQCGKYKSLDDLVEQALTLLQQRDINPEATEQKVRYAKANE